MYIVQGNDKLYSWIQSHFGCDGLNMCAFICVQCIVELHICGEHEHVLCVSSIWLCA